MSSEPTSSCFSSPEVRSRGRTTFPALAASEMKDKKKKKKCKMIPFVL